jgi:hypothetical protein
MEDSVNHDGDWVSSDIDMLFCLDNGQGTWDQPNLNDVAPDLIMGPFNADNVAPLYLPDNRQGTWDQPNFNDAAPDLIMGPFNADSVAPLYLPVVAPSNVMNCELVTFATPDMDISPDFNPISNNSMLSGSVPQENLLLGINTSFPTAPFEIHNPLSHNPEFWTELDQSMSEPTMSRAENQALPMGIWPHSETLGQQFSPIPGLLEPQVPIHIAVQSPVTPLKRDSSQSTRNAPGIPPLKGVIQSRIQKPKKKSVQRDALPSVFCFKVNSDAPTMQQYSKYSAARLKEVQQMRDLGACLRCRLLKKPVSLYT